MLIARKTYNSKNLFVVSAHIETIKNAFADTVYLEFYKEFQQDSKISMKVSSTTLRAIAFAMQNLVEKGSTNFKKINSSQGGTKTLSFNLTQDGNYFINMQSGNEKRYFQTDAYMFEAMAKDIALIADVTQKALYSEQQKQPI
jgi:hypothetical protein